MGERPAAEDDMRCRSRGCAPIVRAYEAGAAASEFYAGAETFASGLRVPKPYGDAIILEIRAGEWRDGRWLPRTR